MSAKQSEALRRRWQDPAYRAKQAQANRVNGAAYHARIAEMEHRIAELEAELARRDEVQRKAVLG